ncbi:MAG: hypothetical protein AAF515_23105 [Pseudomonadota bacterium]
MTILIRSPRSNAADEAAIERIYASPRDLLSALAGWCACLLLLGLLSTTIAPSYNWDLVPYVALAGERDETTSRAWHEQTWRDLASAVPGTHLALLRGAVAPDAGERSGDILQFRRRVAEDPIALEQQLPFYAVKPAYPLAIRGLVAIGLEPVRAAFAISVAGWFALGLALFALLRVSFRLWVALGLLGVFMALPMVRALGGFATPDSWCAALLVAGMVALTVSRPRYVSALVFFVFAVLVRPDSLLLLLPIAAVLAIGGCVSWRVAASAALIGALCFFAQSTLSGNYGWLTLMHYSFVDYDPYPRWALQRVGLSELLQIYWSQFGHTRQFFWFLALGGGLTLLAVRTRWLWPLLALLAYMGAHWLVFPDQKDRMLVGAYLVIVAAAAQLSLRWLIGLPRLRVLLATSPEAR